MKKILFKKERKRTHEAAAPFLSPFFLSSFYLLPPVSDLEEQSVVAGKPSGDQVFSFAGDYPRAEGKPKIFHRRWPGYRNLGEHHGRVDVDRSFQLLIPAVVFVAVTDSPENGIVESGMGIGWIRTLRHLPKVLNQTVEGAWPDFLQRHSEFAVVPAELSVVAPPHPLSTEHRPPEKFLLEIAPESPHLWVDERPGHRIDERQMVPPSVAHKAHYERVVVAPPQAKLAVCSFRQFAFEVDPFRQEPPRSVSGEPRRGKERQPHQLQSVAPSLPTPFGRKAELADPPIVQRQIGVVVSDQQVGRANPIGSAPFRILPANPEPADFRQPLKPNQLLGYVEVEILEAKIRLAGRIVHELTNDRGVVRICAHSHISSGRQVEAFGQPHVLPVEKEARVKRRLAFGTGDVRRPDVAGNNG